MIVARILVLALAFSVRTASNSPIAVAPAESRLGGSQAITGAAVTAASAKLRTRPVAKSA